MADRTDTLVDHAPCRDCAQHTDEGTGCRVVEEGSAVALDAFLAREPCYLKEHLDRFVRRYLSQRPRSILAPEDLAQEVCVRLLHDDTIRAGGFARGLGGFLAYLRQTAVRSAISVERHERGRIRCGNCRHYAPWSGVCLQEGHVWTHRDVPTSQDPRRLEPPCREYVPRRDPRALGPEVEPAAAASDRFSEDREGELGDAVHEALVELAETHPRAALVVRGRLLDGKTYEALASSRGVAASVRTMKRDFALGVAFLRRKLAAFSENVAPEPESERSRHPENA